MVVRGWVGAVATAVGVAVAAGAAQLGLGYGMDIIRWAPDPSGDAWTASLTWASWVAATSTIAGAIVAGRLHPRPGTAPATTPSGDRGTRLLWRLVLAAAAGVGAMATVGLVAVPARVAEVAGVAAPQAVAASHTALGGLVGLLVVVGALAARAVAANLIATAAWLWLLAVATVVDQVVAGRAWSPMVLGFWELPATTGGWFRNILLPDAGPALAAALVIGAVAALPAARRGDHPAGVVISGAAGPVVLVGAYLLAQPDLAGLDPAALSRHLVAPYLVIAGLAGSLAATAIRPHATADPPPT